MFKSFWGSQEQQEIPTESWYPSSVVGSSPNSSRPSTANSSSGLSGQQRTSDRPESSSHGQFSPSEAAGIIAVLKDKSVDELRKLLNDKDAYSAFLRSLDQVKIQNNLRDELRKETTQLARENLEKEPRILELRNQCRIIRTTELAAAQEKLNELERQKEENLRFFSPRCSSKGCKMRNRAWKPVASVMDRYYESKPRSTEHESNGTYAMNKTEEESEILHRQFLDKEIDLAVFVQKYKKLRTTYHRRALLHLAAKTYTG